MPSVVHFGKVKSRNLQTCSNMSEILLFHLMLWKVMAILMNSPTKEKTYVLNNTCRMYILNRTWKELFVFHLNVTPQGKEPKQGTAFLHFPKAWTKIPVWSILFEAEKSFPKKVYYCSCSV